MASAKGGVHVVQLKPITVSKTLVDGCKFVRWDDDSNIGTPVVLKVDKKGFFLYWTDQYGETEFLEISNIRDTRTGKYAKTPRNEGKLKESINIGPLEIPLEDKTLTIAYATDFVNVSFINFCTYSRELAQEWTEEILKMAYNLLAINGSVYCFLEKAHTKLLLNTDRDGKLPIKNVIKMFANHKDDKKRVEKALETCDLPFGKNDSISLDVFDMSKFFNFYKQLIGRNEVQEIFDRICHNSSSNSNKKKVMTVDQFVEFLNKEQRDPRLNEILYPYANRARGFDLIEQYEPNKELAKGLLSFDGFLLYLMSDDNAIVPAEKFDLNSDMDQPLSHYFINSSHNTYLTGHQLTGKSSVEIYRQCLLAGCRCIELDCWNGRSDDEPIITHGYTVVTEVPLKEVLEAIAESAFKTSYYPVILSFENHCSSKQQAKMAQYCRKIFGDMLLTEPLSSHPLKPGVPLPAPNYLLKKIIIKNKKKHYKRARKGKGISVASAVSDEAASTVSHSLPNNMPSNASSSGFEPRPELVTSNSDDSTHILPDTDDLYLNGTDSNSSVNTAAATVNTTANNIGPNPNIPKHYSCDIDEPDSDTSLEEDDINEEPSIADLTNKEQETYSAMSELVIYVQPIRFHTFELAEKRDRSFEVSSFDETQSTSLLKERPVDFVNYNKRQLSRIYPRGTRVNSSNYMPQIFWNAGCQMVALNFQTLDLGMQLNLGIFEYNGRNGYLLKPDFMRRQDRRFDPFTESTVDGIIAGTVSIKIISGQFLSDKRVGTYVEVDMYGLPADTVRRKRTKIVPNNGLNPVYDEEPFVFKKVVLPELACLRIAAFEENGKFIGTRILPVAGLRPGYRHISLRNEALQPLTLPTLFVHITVKDYIPDGLSELADALANPIAYQSMVEKHAKQLLALTDDMEDNMAMDAPNHKTSGYFSDSKSITDDDNTRQLLREISQVDIASAVSASRAELVRAEQNGATTSSSKCSSKVSSPTHKGFSSMRRQDTLNRKMTSSLKSHDDLYVEKNAFLDSIEAHPLPESLEELKKYKNVQKILGKIDRDVANLQKRYDKLREKYKENYQQEEEKASQILEKNKKMTNSSSKSLKKTGSKRQSIVDIQVFEDEYKNKVQDLQKQFSDNVLNSYIEQYKEELKIFESKHEQLCAALDKAGQDSQNAQVQQINTLHSKDVAALMKRLDAQNKEELLTLSKTHKEKNEMARIKRELQQKLIDQAVYERQRFQSLLDKRLVELNDKHEEAKKKWEEEKQMMLQVKRNEYRDKCDKLSEDYGVNGALFVHNYLGAKKAPNA